jgi:nucleoside-diphosphate-sugar epimerase
MTARPCLITGGSGFLGINLVRHMLSRGRRIRSLDTAPFDYPEKERIEVILGDIRDAGTVERAMADAPDVVHCAAALPLASEAEIVSAGVEGTRLLLEAALRHRVERFVFISSTAVYGIPDHHPIGEHDRLQGVGPYGCAKIEAERLCAEYRSKGLCVPVLRPKSFIGPERLGVFEVLYEWAFEGRSFPVLGAGDNRYQLLDVADLCQVIELCLTGDSTLVNDTFNVGAREFGTMRENFQAVLDRAGHGRRVVPLPAAPAIFALRLLRAAGVSPLYEWIYETAGLESFVSTEKLERKLGYVARRSNRQALIANYDWYVAHRDELQGRCGTSHRVPWKKGFLQWAKRFF